MDKPKTLSYNVSEVLGQCKEKEMIVTGSNTKQRIADTLLEMTKTMPLDKITVGALTARCGISRQSFYYHFHDLMEIASWSIRYNLSRMLPDPAVSTPYEALEALLHTFAKNMRSIETLLQTNRGAELQQIIEDALREYFRAFSSRYSTPACCPLATSEMTFTFYACAIAGTIRQSLETGKLDEAALTETILELSERSFVDLYGSLREAPKA